MLSERTKKGIEAVLKVEMRANELGYIVSKPTTDCCRYDLIIDDGVSLKRVQVKYAGHKPFNAEGSVNVGFRKMSINGKSRPSYSRDEIDAIIVYIPAIDRLCYLPIDLVDGKQSINLRYAPSKNNQTARAFSCEQYFW